jgi:hypothetical protein
MQAQRLPARHGWYWLCDGFRLWRKSTAFLSFLTFGCLLIFLVAGTVPWIGQIIAWLILPALSVGVLDGCRAIEAKSKLAAERIFSILFSGFRRERNFPVLAAAGAAHLAARVLVIAATPLIDGGMLKEVVTGARMLDENLVATPVFQAALLAATALTTLALMAYWFAPPLAGWWKLSAPKAMFFSFVACLLNWRAFIVYSLGLVCFGIFVPILIIGVADLLFPGLGTVVLLVFLSVAIPIVSASFYASTRDVFGLPEWEAGR